MKKVHLRVVIFVMFILFSGFVYSAIPASERAALIALYNSTNGDSWTDNSNWKTPPLDVDGFAMPGTENTWWGITVQNVLGIDHVTDISLGLHNLAGTLPTQLENLSNLNDLSLGSNQLTGSIPIELGNLSNLTQLDLPRNQLTGSIPTVLGNLSNLNKLNLSSNQLTGSIPIELGNLSNLTCLILDHNQLTGSIPTQLGNLSNLYLLSLGSNQLTGTIPTQLGNLSNLLHLSLHGNQLTGTIPTQLGNLSNLTHLFLNRNELTGSIPTQLGNLSNLTTLSLGSNQLTGTILTQLGNLSNLRYLSLHDNQLTGSIPIELGNLSNLTHLRLYSNQLTGTIPTQLGNLSNLTHLDLPRNQLTGTIPTQLGNLSNLTHLYLSSNQLTGSIPTQLGNLSNLTRLTLYSNQLTGSIPTELGNLSNLQRLHLESNQLTGDIPASLSSLSSLFDGWSDIRWNALYTNNAALKTFLDSKQMGGNWESTQTIAPGDVAAGSPTYNSIQVSWTPIVYTGNTGGYWVFYSTTPGGPYTFFNTTVDKTVSQMDITGLNQGTTYYFVVQTRTYAHGSNSNIVDSEYSAEVSASTLTSLTKPTVTTTGISAVTSTTASSGGNVTSDGGASVTARGVCWSTSPNPRTTDNKTVNGTGTGSFNSNITGLMENTTYYVRAYATNTAGTGYGNEMSFTTLAESIIVTITEPQDNAYVSGAVTIKATAVSTQATASNASILAVEKMEFYVDDAKIAEDTDEPYETTWDSTSAADGSHTVKALAYNVANQASQDEITVHVGNIPPEIMLTRTHLNYGSVPQGGTTSYSPNSANLTTGPQTILINNIGGGILNWSVTKDADWLTYEPESGIGPGAVTVSVDPSGLETGTYNATISIQDPNASNSPQTVPVTLKVYGSGTTTTPFGYFETPIDGSTLKSSVPVTGWVLDDIDITSVKIYRDPIPGHETGGLVYIGDAVMVDGARPDVEQQFPTYPKDYQAGWGYMMLTNYLPFRGNGIFTIYAKATDKEGNEVTLGSKTVTCDNANAVKPFGAIDTPVQGGTASGSNFVNWGWVLTPQPNTIPTDGSTITVWVDGVPLGNPVYNLYREDIATLFPDYNNSNGAVGYFYLDTTNYLNGVHTIAWSAADNAGNMDGIGSRYFTIVNTGGAGTNHSGIRQMKHIDASIIQQSTLSLGAVYVKKGYDTNASFEVLSPEHEGIISIRSREDQRVEIFLKSDLSSDSAVFGYMLKGDRLQPLPIGSFMDTINGIFYWQPCAGFFGRYRFVFVEKGADGHFTKKLVNVVINPKY